MYESNSLQSAVAAYVFFTLFSSCEKMLQPTSIGMKKNACVTDMLQRLYERDFFRSGFTVVKKAVKVIKALDVKISIQKI